MNFMYFWFSNSCINTTLFFLRQYLYPLSNYHKSHFGIFIIVDIYIQSLSLRMIIKNNMHRDKSQTYEMRTINYQNAIFQSEWNKIDKIQECSSGIIYMSQSNNFTVCSQFVNHKLAGQVLFFHENRKYLYGNWINNQPHGATVFFMQDVLIIAQYRNGMLIEGTRILMVFEKFNIGVIVQVDSIDRWKIKYKSDVYCSEHIQKLIRYCGFGQEIIHSLIKYINDKLTDLAPTLKLRMVDQAYYRYGFDKGLGIIFDDEYNIKFVGFNNQQYLSEAAKISSDMKKDRQIQIDNIGLNKNEKKKEKQLDSKIGKIYFRQKQNKQNMAINYYYTDPSLSYFKQFQQLLSLPLIKRVFAGFILSNSPQISSPVKQNQKKQKDKSPCPENNQQYFNRYNKQRQLSFNKQRLQLIQEKQQPKFQMKNFNISQQAGDNKNSFQRLPKRYRLNIISDELNNIVIQSNINKHPQENNQQILFHRQSTLINKLNQMGQQKIKENYDQQNRSVKNKQILIFQQSLISSNQKMLPTQVDKRIGRVKKRIFDESKINRKDHSPIWLQDKNLSPLKKRVKIFDQASSNKRKYPNQIQKHPLVTEKMAQINKKVPIQVNQSSISPQNQYKLTLNKIQNLHPKNILKISDLNIEKAIDIQPLPSERIQEEEISPMKNQSKINIYSEQQFKKNNQVYLNRFSNRLYSDYVNYPIPTEQTKNRTYIRNNQNNLANHSPSNPRINPLDSEKKSIINTMPYKQDKVKSYMRDKSNMVYYQKLQKSQRYKNTADKSNFGNE